MGIYIKDFKMPEGGYRTIEIAYDADGHPMALADGGDVFDVIPITAHGRLIDADALLNNKGVGTQIAGWGKMYHETCIEYAPTVIPAERGE